MQNPISLEFIALQKNHIFEKIGLIVVTSYFFVSELKQFYKAYHTSVMSFISFTRQIRFNESWNKLREQGNNVV